MELSFISVKYRTIKRLRCCLYGGLAGSLSSLAVAAGHIWHWTDTTGQQHYSDHLPASGVNGAQRLDTAHHPVPPEAPPAGLRRGEIALLHRIEARTDRRHQDAEADRRRQAQTSAGQRAQCRQARSRWYATQDREQRRKFSDYLRRNCW